MISFDIECLHWKTHFSLQTISILLSRAKEMIKAKAIPSLQSLLQDGNNN